MKALANYYVNSGFSVWIAGPIKLIQNYVIAFQIKLVPVWLQLNSSWGGKGAWIWSGVCHQVCIGHLFLNKAFCIVFLALASE